MSTPPMKLRDLLVQELETFAQLDASLFTTMGFAPDFFERHVVPLLLDGARRDTIGEVVAADEHLARNPVVVVHDAGQLMPGDKRLSYATIPIRLEDALFHAKVILLVGRDVDGQSKASIIVGSANLTRSGWGINVEALATAAVHANTQIHSDVKNFVDELRELAGETSDARFKPLLEGLQGLLPGDDDGTRLIAGRRSFCVAAAELLKEGGSWIACAPYIDGVSALSGWADKHGHPLTIVPGPDAEAHVAVVEKKAKTWESLPIHWAQWRGQRRKSQIGRLVHAKLHLLEGPDTSWLAVGSHNITQRALGLGGPTNVEASLIQPIEEQAVDALRSSLDDLAHGTLVERCSVEAENDAPKPSTVSCRVIIDWTAGTLAVTAIERTQATPGSLELRLPMESALLPLKALERSLGPPADCEALRRKLARGRGFQVRSAGETVFEGLVEELGWEAHRPDPTLQVDDILGAWSVAPEREAQVIIELLPREPLSAFDDPEELGEEVVAGSEPDLFDSYFFLFRAARRRAERMQICSLEDLVPLTLRGSTSLEGFVRALEVGPPDGRKEQHDEVKSLLICWELYRLVELAVARLKDETEHSAVASALLERVRKLQSQFEDAIPVPTAAPFAGHDKAKALAWFREELRAMPEHFA